MDPFQGTSGGMTGPGTHHAAITPNDGADLPVTPRYIFVGNGGNIAMDDQSGTTEIWLNLPSGSIVDFRPKRIRATGTTASAMKAVW